MKREELPNETPREDLMREALKHYEELATKACWHRSDIPDAIRAYYTPLPPAEGAEQLTKEQFTAIIEDSVKDVWYGRRSMNPVKDQTELLVEKLYPLLNNPLPPAEGAEEILSPLCERDDAEDFLATKDIWNHPRISDRTDNESYEVADLMAEFAGQFAALHAQKIADKMVSERLREELIAYDTWCFPIETYKNKIPSPSDSVDKYLKTRASHE